LVLCPRWKWCPTDFRRTVHEFTQRGQSTSLRLSNECPLTGTLTLMPLVSY
jgi:hypothetical protein